MGEARVRFEDLNDSELIVGSRIDFRDILRYSVVDINPSETRSHNKNNKKEVNRNKEQDNYELHELIVKLIEEESRNEKGRTAELSDGLFDLSFDIVGELTKAERLKFGKEKAWGKGEGTENMSNLIGEEGLSEEESADKKKKEEDVWERNKSKKGQVYYYKKPVRGAYGVVDTEQYIFTPGNVQVVRASHAELGENVLGVAFPGLNLIKISDRLQGNEYQEVLKHELNHIAFPHMSEQDIRYMTKRELPFHASYH